jgi:hypothetical protein
MTAVVIACGAAVDTAYAQLRDGAILPPEQSAVVTVAGCLLRGDQVRGGKADKYVLVNPIKGPMASVPENGCTADANDNALVLDNPSKGKVNDSMLGQVVEISGRLERETDTNPDNLRELDVASARVVPVVAPRRAEAPPPAAAPPIAPEPEPIPEAAPEPAPVATAGQAPAALPKTASTVPATGLIGLLALAAAVMLRTVRSQQRT